MAGSLAARAVQKKRAIWLDCDPGHDDAMAILLAGHHRDRLELLGVSTVGCNQTVERTTENALRVTEYYNVPVPVVMGASKPLLRKAKHCAEIHGSSGLDGVDGEHGLPPCSKARMDDWNARGKTVKAVPEMFRVIRGHWEGRGEKVTLCATGSLTNVALALAVYGEELEEALDGIVFMRGSVLEGGNTGPVSEFNVQTDPEAAKLVIESGLTVTMVPLDVTHTTLVTDEIIERIRSLPGDSDAIRRTIDLLLFFAGTYKVRVNAVGVMHALAALLLC
jgi:inosine-uridine nucleoside N-ribohydrolase